MFPPKAICLALTPKPVPSSGLFMVTGRGVGWGGGGGFLSKSGSNREAYHWCAKDKGQKEAPDGPERESMFLFPPPLSKWPLAESPRTAVTIERLE